MATAFARQLRQIAANSTNELDLLRARRAHAESLIFERDIAAKQDWDTLYQICVEGFQELCHLDGRFKDFERTLFGYQSKDQDREQLNKSENEALDSVIEECIELLGSRLTLRPGVKALEWLVRRFRIHVYNTAALLLTVLPYHEAQLFQNALNLVPAGKITDQWKFLWPYYKQPSPLPRHTIVYAATTNDGFFSALNTYVLGACQNGSSHPILMRFWSSVVVDAVAARLKQAKSGRREVEKQRTEDVLIKILPLLNDGLGLDNCADMTVTCYTLTLVIASNRLLGDAVIDSLMQAIAFTLDYPSVDTDQALVCLSILTAQKEEPIVSGRVVNAIAKLDDAVLRLQNIERQYPIASLLQCLVRAALSSVKQKDIDLRMTFVEKLLGAGPALCRKPDLTKILIVIVSLLQHSDRQDPVSNAVSSRLKVLLQKLYDSSEFDGVFSQLAILCQERGVDLEAILEATVPATEDRTEPTEPMEVDVPSDPGIDVESAIAALPNRLPANESFLVAQTPPPFGEILDTLELCSKDEDGLSKFANLDIWGRASANAATYLSFLLRVACGHYNASLRATAASLLAVHLSNQSAVDSQALLPYASILLADHSAAVRREAGNIVLAMTKASPAEIVEGEDCGKIDFPVDGHASDISWFPSTHLVKILRQVYLPHLEECVSDSDQIHLLLQQALTGSSVQLQSPSRQRSIELKKSLRHSLFDCLISHAIFTPLLRVKMGIIRLLESVEKTGSTTRNEVLYPVLQGWISLTPDESARRAEAEGMQLSTIDSVLAELITARDRDSITQIIEAVDQHDLKPRPELITALFDRVASTWTSLSGDGERSVSVSLFDLSLSKDPVLTRGARSALKKVAMSTAALEALLEHSLAAAKATQSDVSPSKRRKRSNVEDKPVQPGPTPVQDVPRAVLVLELADGSGPESRPELMPGLFDILALLRRLKGPLQSDSPYALGLCLTNLLAIVDRAKTMSKPNLDMSNIRADLVTDCVRNTESPQVQAAALALSASLASLAPDRVIHHIMPVFTFMGSNVLSRDDEHSVNVVNKVIDQIIPPLVGKLKQQDESNLIRSTTALLSSFSAAFDHIPQQRKRGLYHRLLRRLGPEDFGFALSAMLEATQSKNGSRAKFIVNMMSTFSPIEQLVTYSKIVSLAADIHSDKPQNAESLLHISTSSPLAEKLDMALSMYSLAESLLRSKHLKAQLLKLANPEPETILPVQEELRNCLHQILEVLRSQRAYGENMTNAMQRCMNALLECLRPSQLIGLLPSLLKEMDRHDRDLKPEALHVLAAQLGPKGLNDSETATAALAYLSDLEDILRTTDNVALRQAALACVDCISEKYGRKDLESLNQVASVLIGNAGLTATESSIQLQSALTLSSVFDILGETAVPIVSLAMDNVFKVVESSFEEGRENAQLHDAAFALISAIVSNVPFMISEEQFDRILSLTADAAFSELPDTCIDARRDTLLYLARKIDLTTLVSSLSRVWPKIIENDIDAVLPALDMCIKTIEHHSKSAVVKAADTISSFNLQALDLRRIQFANRTEESYSEDEVDQIESKLNDLTLKFIYKLNDNVFRSIFESWVDWAVKCYDLPPSTTTLEKAKHLRQTSLFRLLTQFFSNLKSIVTSYAAYVLGPATEILKRFSTELDNTSTVADLETADQLQLYTTLLTLLIQTFLYDADSFFTFPSNFSALSTNLLAQLRQAVHKPFRPIITSHVIPAIVALATAVQDTPSHHMVINHYLAQLRHAGSSHVRLAGIQTHIAITEDGEVGDEWVNNVVSGPATAPPGLGVDGDDSMGGKEGTGAVVGGSGETMIYVNEMLEDDDEEVEKEVRRWVRMVRERVGEDVFEF